MKIQCNACEAAEASVLCCADEAVLCWACDDKVHAVNKLSSKHQRVSLSNSSSNQMSKCDICQETTGYFFCLEDRALLCRKCDVAIHTANSYVSRHQRFLITGVKVGLEPIKPVVPYVKEKMGSTERIAETPSISFPERGNLTSSFVNSGQLVVGIGGLPASKASSTGGTMSGSIRDWPLEEFFGLTECDQSYGFMENGSSKAGVSKLGDSIWSPLYQAATDEDLDVEEYLGQVPEISWTVPEIQSPPIASGLLPRTTRNPPTSNSVFVPDVSQSSFLQVPHGYQPTPLISKCQRKS
eukprot:TRINITY_DN2381_c0_g1_i1.p1 TRINITY_DN2381_c0_g1~~TRINITY_DN2381_c0_g1_i1.p1  ORF type:complete len:297 (-),score=41.26 TRINITY_DN2381_c0_g1_i1:374-1264(-)